METFLCLNSFTFFNVFKHRFGTVEFNQNYLMDEVNLHGQIGTLLKTSLAFSEECTQENIETFLCLNSFAFFNVFKHQFSTVELNQNHFMDEVNLHR